MDGHTVAVAGRVCIGALFLISAHDKVIHFAPTLGMMRAHAIPVTKLALVAAIATEIVGGALLVAGVWLPLAAVVLIAYVVAASALILAKDMSDPTRAHQTKVMLAANLGVVGGLLYVFGSP